MASRRSSQLNDIHSVTSAASVASIAALSQQVLGIEDDHRQLRADVSTLQNKIEDGLRGIYRKLDESAKEAVRAASPQWGIYFSGLALVFAVLTSLGTLAYLPIHQSITDLKATDDRQREQFLRKDVFDVYDKLFHALLDRHGDATNVNRLRLDGLRADFTAIAPPSSAIEEIRKRLERVEQELLNSARRDNDNGK